MVKKDQVQVEVLVDGKKGINELGKLEAEAKELRASLKGLKKDTEEWTRANDKLKEVNANMAKVREQMGLTGMTMKQLTSYQKELQMEWNGLTRGTKEFAKVDAELKRVNSAIAQQRAELKGTAGVWGFLKSEIGKFGALTLAALGIDALIGQISNWISRNAKLSDSLADIRKTTGLSAEGVDQLSKKLGELNTRTSKNDLLMIAKSGGQLGIASKDILAFTASVDKLNVALGDEFGSAEQITKDMGALRNIFSDIKSDQIDQDMLRIGNAINELGATGSATGDVVADMAGRIGGVGVPLGLASGEVLGLAATMQELNINTERGSTAVVKILQKMGTDYKEFAKVAGMDTQKFKELLDKDLFGAFTKVVEGVGKTKGGMAEFSTVMDRLKIDGAGASELVGKLSGNMDLLKGRVDLANTSLKGTDSIMNEFNIKNETFGAQIEKLQKRLAGMFVSGAIMQGMQKFVGYLNEITEIKVSETLEKERFELNLLVDAAVNANDQVETRKNLINEIANKYPQLLDGLSKETVSNIQLLDALKKVNAEYDKKIAIAVFDEQNAELSKKRVELASNIVEMQKQISAIRLTSQEALNAGIGLGDQDQQISNLEQKIETTKKKLLLLENQRNNFIKDQNQLMTELGIAPSDRPTDLGGDGGKGDFERKRKKEVDTAFGSDEGDAKAQAKSEKERLKREKEMAEAYERERKHLADIDDLLAQFDLKREMMAAGKREKEMLELDARFEQEILKVGGHQQEMLNNDLLTTDQKKQMELEYQVQIDTLEQQWRDAKNLKKEQWKAEDEQARLDLQAKIDLESMSDKDREIEETIRHYEALIAEAKKFGLNYAGLQEMMLQRVADIQKKNNKDTIAEEKKTVQARLQAQSALENGLRGMLNALGSMMSDDIGFQTAITTAQIFIDTAAAISATAAASAKNPSNAVTFGLAGAAQFAAGVIRIMANMAMANQTLGKANKVDPPSYFEGGFTGNSAMGYDKYGPVAGLVHTNEYVIPARMMSNPGVVNVTRALEAMRTNTNSTEATKAGPPMPASSPAAGSGLQVNELGVILTDIKSLLQKRQEIVFVQTEYERFTQDQNTIKFSAQK